jgi:hypothetical protein
MAVPAQRKKSPRAPSMALDEALDRAMKAYDRDRLHPGPTEVIAQHLGYKGANNGAALSALASLRYFGLLDRPSEGLLAVTKEVESFKFSPDEAYKRELLAGFLTKPALYADLLEKFPSGLPSDSSLRFDLIQRGFAPQSADLVLSAFRRSVEFAHYFDRDPPERTLNAPVFEVAPTAPPLEGSSPGPKQFPPPHLSHLDESTDSIPVRLPGGRRAWLLVPTPFFEGDKARLKAQIDLLLTQEEDDRKL